MKPTTFKHLVIKAGVALHSGKKIGLVKVNGITRVTYLSMFLAVFMLASCSKENIAPVKKDNFAFGVSSASGQKITVSIHYGVNSLQKTETFTESNFISNLNLAKGEKLFVQVDCKQAFTFFVDSNKDGMVKYSIQPGELFTIENK
jgi:hypothetical protein